MLKAVEKTAKRSAHGKWSSETWTRCISVGQHFTLHCQLTFPLFAVRPRHFLQTIYFPGDKRDVWAWKYIWTTWKGFSILPFFHTSFPCIALLKVRLYIFSYESLIRFKHTKHIVSCVIEPIIKDNVSEGVYWLVNCFTEHVQPSF